MRKFYYTLLIFLICYSFLIAIEKSENKVLFVHGRITDGTGVYINGLKEELKNSKIEFDSLDLTKKDKYDISEYNIIIIYRRSMAFNMLSGGVRHWIIKQSSFKDKKILLFGTAKGGLSEPNVKRMNEVITEKEGDIIDTISMATSSISDKKVKKYIKQAVKKVKNALEDK